MKNLKETGRKTGATLTPDYVDYDGTNDIEWNARYGELVKFK